VCFTLHAFAWKTGYNNWFEETTKETYGVEICDPNVPRVRKAWSSATTEERTLYVRLVVQLKQHKEAYTTGSPTPKALYDAFVEIHGGTGQNRNSGWHYTTMFPFCHKGMLWMYESALRFVALVDGPNMIPAISRDEACSFALLYWDWDCDYDSNTKDTVYPIYNSEIWKPSNLIGSPNTVAPYYYVNDGAFSGSNWPIKYPVCSDPTSPESTCTNTTFIKDAKLKRYLTKDRAPNLDPTQILKTFYAKPNSLDFTPWINAQAHMGMHTFIAFSMGTQKSPDEPLFFLHHCNVDRYFHMWASCNGYDAIDPSKLGPKQFTSVNPTTTSPADCVKINNVEVVFNLDMKITYNLDSSKAPIFLPSALYPTPRDLWSMGEPGCLGWQGLHVLYEDDRLPFSPMSSVCTAAKGWSWFVTSSDDDDDDSQKRDTANPTNADLIYENITSTFMYLTEQRGMSPREAIDKMAMDACLANPTVITDDDKKLIGSMGFPLSGFQRICDEEIKDDNVYYRPMHHH